MYDEIASLGLCSLVCLNSHVIVPPPQQVREVELSMDMASILHLLDFLQTLSPIHPQHSPPPRLPPPTLSTNRLTDYRWHPQYTSHAHLLDWCGFKNIHLTSLL
jgi:hypothetical protein